MKFPKLAAAALLAAALPTVGHAQQAQTPQIAQGAKVFDPQGAEVGTIEQVSGDTAVLNTGGQTATLQKSAFGTNEKGLTISYTKEQLNQAIAAANQATDDKLNTALVPGAALRTSDGVAVGTVKSVDNGQVVVEREGGPIVLTRDNFAVDANGLIIRLTSQQLNEAVAKVNGPAAEGAPGAEATTTPASAPAGEAASQPAGETAAQPAGEAASTAAQ